MSALGLMNVLTSIREENGPTLFVSFLITEHGNPITEEDGDNLIRENL